MKLITSLISIVALSFATFALAQEQETPSPASEQKASAALEQTTTPTPEKATTPTPSDSRQLKKKKRPLAPSQTRNARVRRKCLQRVPLQLLLQEKEA